MKKITSDEIRRRWLGFFKEKGHLVVPSSPLIPHGDPTLLLTNAGMVQMKPYFLGEEAPPAPRLTSIQKCFRTSDIESVGNERSLTFFEMCGNFSVGDYFKDGAISFAWELSTQRFKFPAERIWVTIYPDDDEAFALWQKIAGIPTERICRQEDNWWGPAGETGPCGPDSELYYDRGPEYGCGKPTCGPGCDCARFLEYWNLVFMQYYQDENKVRTPLPKTNIDTGLGLERAALLLQGAQTVYETDLFSPIIRREEEIAGIKYGKDARHDFSLRVIADHSRAATFLIADGVLPSNEGRGYILRRVIRRAVRHGKSLGLERPFLIDTVSVVIERMKDSYPELVEREDFIHKVIGFEESRFNQTLSTGLNVLDGIVADLKAKGQNVIPGDVAFRLYDTFGFPKELTAEVAEEHELTVDLARFGEEMERQREKARAAAKFGLGPKQRLEVYEQLAIGETGFVGHDHVEFKSPIIGIVAEGSSVEKASAGQKVELILEQTPFYPEGGGQVGDTGIIVGEAGKARVLDTQRPLPTLIVHEVEVTEGYLEVGDTARALVDVERRRDTARHHTATHLLHKALRQVLGPHATQAGSLVAPDRFRFDFTHLTALTRDELNEVARIVREKIRENMAVTATLASYTEATEAGAMALFGEKYGEVVRVISVDTWSRELCGGTHVARTGDIGSFVIVDESSVGTGLRRIEALAGRAADEYIQNQRQLLERLTRRLQTTNVEDRVNSLLAEVQSLRREVSQLQRLLATKEVEALVARAQEVNGVKVVAAQVPPVSMEVLREMGDSLRSRLGRSVVVLGSVFEGKPGFVAMVSPGVQVHAGQIAKQVAAAVGGSGGGRPDMAQAGGKDPSKIREALQLVLPLVKDSLKKVAT
ncbi:MAG: alanine--tRNA ligase [Dehalococcoidales bacterium]|nr:alanine--tRNA ligase [Dehalococcoidales bacterium]